MSLTVVIPSVGKEPLLRQCLWSLAASATHAGIGDLRIVVIDNASPTPYETGRLSCDASVRLVRFDTPRSFAAACNTGAAFAEDGHDLLMLNNDVFLHPMAIADAFAAREQTRADICGARLVYPDDTIQHCGVLFDGGERGPYHWHHRTPSNLVARRHRRFQSVTGAFHLMPTALFRRLDGFDESYPFAYEDVDLCLRAGQMGCIIVCAQGVDSIHLQGSSRTERSRALEVASREVFFSRWRGRFTVDGSEDDQ